MRTLKAFDTRLSRNVLTAEHSCDAVQRVSNALLSSFLVSPSPELGRDTGNPAVSALPVASCPDSSEQIHPHPLQSTWHWRSAPERTLAVLCARMWVVCSQEWLK
eukprot:5022566-Amphidinium_carterae.1